MNNINNPMKKHLLLLSIFISGLLSAQNERFFDPVFDSILVTSDVEFGSADQLLDVVGPNSNPTLTNPILKPVVMRQTLYFDLYEPAGDNMENRPMIVLAFGGAFVFGTKSDAYMVELATRYAQLGYVVASIDYRLTREMALAALDNEKEIPVRAVLKGTHDMKAAIRFFRKAALFDGNPYKIDANQIYTGGLSAGAFTATHAAYLNEFDELPEQIKAYAEENGGIEGLSGTPGVSSHVAGVISLSGALGDTAWMKPGDVPIVSTHGTADEVVPYGSDSVTILGINYPVDGSSVIHKKADMIGLRNAFYTYQGASHAPESGQGAYLDTGFTFTKNFMYQLVSEYYGASSVENINTTIDVTAYPNPSNGMVYFKNANEINSITVINSLGKTVKVISNPSEKIDLSSLEKGYYILNINTDNNTLQQRLMMK